MRNRSLSCFVLLLLTSCAVRLNDNNNAEIKSELARMVEVDQIAAYIPQGKYKRYSQNQWDTFKDSVFTSNQKSIEAMFKKHGFLGFDKVGKEGSSHFWLLTQHCDKFPAFQTNVLIAMNREVKKGNANPNNYAYLYDRVKVNAGEKQLFGTQLTYEVETTGRAIPKNGLIDSVNIDELRKEYDLGPLREYLNGMTEMHYEMNKNNYEEKGIMKPSLY